MPLKNLSVWHKQPKKHDDYSAVFQSASHQEGEQATTLPMWEIKQIIGSNRTAASMVPKPKGKVRVKRKQISENLC